MEVAEAMARPSPRLPPLLRLPDEVLAIIIEYVLTNPYEGVEGHESDTPVSDFFCVCSQIYRVGIPIIYRRITWRGYPQSHSLLAALQTHPEYAQHVCDLIVQEPQKYQIEYMDLARFGEIEYRLPEGYLKEHDPVHVAQLVRLLHRAILSSPTPDRKLEMLSLNFSQSRIADVADIIRRLQPAKFWWQVDPIGEHCYFDDEDDAFEVPWPDPGASLLTDFSGMADWLMRLVYLYVSDSAPDSVTSTVLAACPSLRKLFLTLMGQPDDFVKYLSTVLTTGETSKNLDYLMAVCDKDDERFSVQTGLGVCLPVARTVSMPGTWYGCEHSCDREGQPPEAHALGRPLDVFTTCPRCCILAGQAREAGSSESQRQIASPECVFVGDSKDVRTSASEKYPHGLCKRHHDEIFGENHGDDAERQANFLRRRALECMKWD